MSNMLPFHIVKRPDKSLFRKRPEDAKISLELENIQTASSRQDPISSGFAAVRSQNGTLINKDSQGHELTNTVSYEGLDSDDVRLLDQDVDFPDGGLKASLFGCVRRFYGTGSCFWYA